MDIESYFISAEFVFTKLPKTKVELFKDPVRTAQ